MTPQEEKVHSDFIKKMIKYILDFNPDDYWANSFKIYFEKNKNLSEKQFDILTQIYSRELKKHTKQ